MDYFGVLCKFLMILLNIYYLILKDWGLRAVEDNKNFNSTNNNDAFKRYEAFQIRLEALKQKRKIINKYANLCSLFLAILGTLYFLTVVFDYEPNAVNIATSILLGSLIGITFILNYNMLFEIKENSLRRKMFTCEADSIKDDIGADIFENSIKMSYKYLDQYYLQTREQAQRGFFVTLCVAVFGALLLSIGILAMFLGHTDPSYITCASGIITEFISAIFFYLYNKTISSMSKYHNKLVLSQNISIALKLSDSLPPEEGVNAKNVIIGELLKDINIHLVTDSVTNADKDK